jgi:hypothetical protein
LRRGGADRTGLEFQTFHQAGRDDFHGIDHPFPLKPDFGFRAADVMAGELGSVAEPQDVASDDSGETAE